MEMESDFIIILCSCPSEEIGQPIAEHIVEAKLAGCVTIIPNLRSIYIWEGKKEVQSEVLLLIKTTRSVYSKLEQRLIDLHPYECPEIIGIPIDLGNTGYLQWITNSIASIAKT